MESSSGDDYGELDDADMLMLATQAEGGDITPPVQRAGKRRRLNDPVEVNNDGNKRGKSKPAQIPRDVLPLGRVSPIDDDEGAFDRPVYVPRSKNQRSVEPDNETDTPKKKPKSKYRIHIPKQADIPKDAFLTQPPQPSSSPYRIRGPIWQKQKKVPIAQSPNSTGVEKWTPPNTRPKYRSSPSMPPSSDEEEAFGPSPHPLRVVETPSDELAGLPSDVFASSSPSPSKLANKNNTTSSFSQNYSPRTQLSQHSQILRMTGTQTNIRQTTLFGSTANRLAPISETPTGHSWPLTNKKEAPTHHKLDLEAMKTWVYPTNLGTIRDYQFNIVQRGLYHNLLVALPTGLGKTFIAATIMLNWFRWTTESHIMFVAPTKPLVSQQVEACFSIAGIPRSATTMLTGETASRLRSEEYLTKRVFFMTPQTLMNDLRNGNCDPKKIVLLVVDEAHRATGSYSYVEIVKLLRRFSKSFRVLALTATPGGSVEAVQAVIDGLDISRVEIRTENSIDIRQYVHSRKVDTQIFDYSEEMEMVMDLWKSSLQPVLNRLNGMNTYLSKNPLTLTPYGLTMARQKWSNSDAGKRASKGTKVMVNTVFTILSSRAHATVLLEYHGIGPFYQNLLAFRNATESGEKGGKYRREIIESEHFQRLMSRIQIWVNNPEFVGHPKLEYLRTVILNHFLDANEGHAANSEHASSTKIMVFVHYRNSAEEVARVLKRHEPMIRPHVFVGQANSQGSEGMDQRKQSEIIEKFKKGIYNTMIATSIGEEGLDIGEVDLIVCYDSSASPIRMLQRMGRTGRKRAGNIVVLLMRGKEKESFTKAKDSYDKMQKMIAEGSRFTFHDDRSTRIVPKEIQPLVVKRTIDIPLENTQPGLPMPKRQAKRAKKPPKKFYMPDGVRTGFVKASRLRGTHDESQPEPSDAGEVQPDHLTRHELEIVPSNEDVLLTTAEERHLARAYLDIGGDTPQVVEAPQLDAFPALQRKLRRTKHLGHGRTTRRVVTMLQRMHAMDTTQVERFERNLHPEDTQSDTLGAFAASSFSILRMTPADEAVRRISAPTTRRAEPIWSSPHNLTSSTDEHDVQTSLGAFVTDDDSEAADATIGAGSSVTSSPPPLHAQSKPFYTPLGKSYELGSGSEEDLPEFGKLVGRAGFVTATTLSRAETGADQGHVRPLSQRRARVRRKVVQDGSDEE
ncbi:3'-5' DNA helicase [Acarospora aff. strigata]|nr:3'-5' DNA helicase [Acarospora aff. strigata]